jgi:hypothetical protein
VCDAGSIAPAGVPPFEEFGNDLRTQRDSGAEVVGTADTRRPRACVQAAVIEYPMNSVIFVALPIVEKIV